MTEVVVGVLPASAVFPRAEKAELFFPLEIYPQQLAIPTARSGLYGFALWATRRDPDMLRILLSSSRVRRRYDPGKHEPFDVDVASW